MQIFIKTLTFGTVGVKVDAFDTIHNIKRSLARKIDDLFTGYDVEMAIDYEKTAQWIFADKLLQDECTLASYDIVKESTLECRFHLGGTGIYVSSHLLFLCVFMPSEHQ